MKESEGLFRKKNTSVCQRRAPLTEAGHFHSAIDLFYCQNMNYEFVQELDLEW